MKIDFGSNLPVYRKPDSQVVRKQAAPAERAARTDVADFSRALASSAGAETASLKAGILHEAAAPAGTDKLAGLQERIRAGSYHPSTDEIVDAILGS